MQPKFICLQITRQTIILITKLCRWITNWWYIISPLRSPVPPFNKINLGHNQGIFFPWPKQFTICNKRFSCIATCNFCRIFWRKYDLRNCVQNSASIIILKNTIIASAPVYCITILFNRLKSNIHLSGKIWTTPVTKGHGPIGMYLAFKLITTTKVYSPCIPWANWKFFVSEIHKFLKTLRSHRSKNSPLNVDICTTRGNVFRYSSRISFVFFTSRVWK